MSNDVSIGLLEEIQESFNLGYEQSSKIKKLLKKLDSTDVTYEDAQNYAIEVGDILADAFENHVDASDLPNEKMYLNIAQKLLEPTLANNYDLISDYSTQVQSALNKSANVGLKAISPSLNENRIHGLAWNISRDEIYSFGNLRSQIVNFNQSIVDDSIKANADMHYKAGRSPTITRKVYGNACAWCMNLAGAYNYKEAPDDIYRRHDNCRCQVTYDPKNDSRGVQDVWSKEWSSDVKNDIISLERTSNDETAYPLKSVPERFQRYVPDKATREKIIEESLKLEKPIFMNDTVGKYAQYIQPKDGMYDVVIHGNKYFVEYFGKRIDPDTLCAMIAQRGNYKKGQSIRLISCNTGAVSDGVADYVANKLHVKVEAPTTTAYVYEPKNGVSKVIPESSKGVKDGIFKLFDGTVKKDG